MYVAITQRVLSITGARLFTEHEIYPIFIFHILIIHDYDGQDITKTRFVQTH